jgi:heat shock protein HtpX
VKNSLVKIITEHNFFIIDVQMGMLKLKVSMIGTLALIIGLSTLFFTVILSLFEIFSIYTLALFIVVINIVQWLAAPYLIDALYHVKRVSKNEEPELYNMMNKLSRKSYIKMPKLMVANIPIPNAFAYGSPLTGTRIAVTKGLLDNLDNEEVEAVIGHELGHLKHKDVQVMMFVSILPAIFYYIGFSLMWSTAYNRRSSRESGSSTAVIGFISIILYWVLTLFTLYLSRLREYYADRHSISVVEDGSRKLSEGLVKIAQSTENIKRRSRRINYMNSLKTLFISDPDNSTKDLRDMYRAKIIKSDEELVEKYLRKRVSSSDELIELFSTHPNMVKRLKALKGAA